jgi:hypothetical protein
MGGWNGLTEMNDTEGTRICWVSSTSSLLAETKYANTACRVRYLRLTTRQEWNLHSTGPSRSVEQQSASDVSETSCWSHLHTLDNPKRMPDIVWAMPGILLGSLEPRRRDQQDVPKRRHQTTVQRCITAQKSGYFCSYKLSYCFKSFTVVR